MARYKTTIKNYYPQLPNTCKVETYTDMKVFIEYAIKYENDNQDIFTILNIIALESTWGNCGYNNNYINLKADIKEWRFDFITNNYVYGTFTKYDFYYQMNRQYLAFNKTNYVKGTIEFLKYFVKVNEIETAHNYYHIFKGLEKILPIQVNVYNEHKKKIKKIYNQILNTIK